MCLIWMQQSWIGLLLGFFLFASLSTSLTDGNTESLTVGVGENNWGIIMEGQYNIVME